MSNTFYFKNDNELYHFGILGMKWGVRRYQNTDGSLTPAGKKRYAQDIRENKAKKKDNRIDTSSPDPQRWAKEDLQRTKKVNDSVNDLVNKASDLEKKTRPKKTRLDLSSKSDNELRSEIQRELLERQYNDLFNTTESQSISKGRKVTEDILSALPVGLGIVSSSLGIALAIQELKQKG